MADRRPPYTAGEKVRGMYLHPTAGTVLAGGTVTACQRPERGDGWRVTVAFAERSETYRVSITGRSDYLTR